MNDFKGFARGSRKGDAPDPFDWGIRTHVYAAFARSGKAPTVDDLSAVTGAPAGRITASLRALADARELVLDGRGEGLRMAHPFSAVPTDFRVETTDFDCYANCAWDALGILAVLASEGCVETTCSQTGEPLEFGVEKRTVTGDASMVVHLLTPLREAWDDIGYT